jgi:hypothetical protein
MENAMVALTTIEKVHAVLLRRCTPEQVDRIVSDLEPVPGDRYFRETVEILARIHDAVTADASAGLT